MRLLLLGNQRSVHMQKWLTALSQQAELQVESFSLPVCRRAWMKWRYICTVPRLFWRLYRFQPDIVHAHYVSSYGLLGAVCAAKRLYVSVWGQDVFEFPRRSIIHRRLLCWVLRRAQRLFSTSQCMRLELQRYTQKPITVIPFGVNITVFRPTSEQPVSNVLTIGTVKALESIYGLDVLLRAFAQLKTSVKLPIRLRLIG